MSSPVPLELAAKIASWRQRSAEGTLSIEEMREAVAHLRAGRVSAANASAASKRKKAIAEIPSAQDMLDDLENM